MVNVTIDATGATGYTRASFPYDVDPEAYVHQEILNIAAIAGLPNARIGSTTGTTLGSPILKLIRTDTSAAADVDLDESKTFRQNGIQDGSLLQLADV